MGFEGYPQFDSKDGCIYIYNKVENHWYKFCPVDVVPADVRIQIMEIKEKADALKDA